MSSEDTYMTCPFNRSHKVLTFRMPQHIVKCRKNYNGETLKECPFNATHFIKESEFEEHLENCRDYENAFNDKFIILIIIIFYCISLRTNIIMMSRQH